MSSTYVCNHCGQEHEGLPTDWGFTLPDEVHELSFVDRYLRSRHNRDLCTLDESRYFFRALLQVPILGKESGAMFGWGLWVEVTKPTHDLYLKSWNTDISSRPRCLGHIANEIMVYGQMVGLSVEIEFRAGTDRPHLWFPPDASNALAFEQREGISGKRHHDILMALGHFGSARDA